MIKWFQTNSLQANGSKFQTIVFSRMNKDNVPIMINKNIILEPQSCVKLLGVQIDNRLTFHDHISSLCKKAGQKLGAVHDCQRIYKQM